MLLSLLPKILRLLPMQLLVVFHRLFDAVEKHYGIKIEFTFPDSDEVKPPLPTRPQTNTADPSRHSLPPECVSPCPA